MRLFEGYSDKDSAMQELKERGRVLAGQLCSTYGLVWGEGALSARVALVGEAPGDKEDKLGRPFVGPAGKLLDRELLRAGIKREEVWLTNIAKCRPTTESAGKVINRSPTVKEVNAWKGLLQEELDIIAPEIIICLGAVAAKAIIDKDFSITRQRGEWFDTLFGPRAIATWHPAYILRQLDESWDRSLGDFRRDLELAANAVRRAA